MAATKTEIAQWFKDGQKQKAARMLIVCDTFDYEDYPHYVDANDDAQKVARERYGHPGQKDMQRVMECYDLTKPLEEQLAVERVFNW